MTGTIDESIRHAMTKFAHYHFAANQDATDRLIKMGERPDRVFNVGCPSIDAILDVRDNPAVISAASPRHISFLYSTLLPVRCTSLIQIEVTLRAIRNLGRKF